MFFFTDFFFTTKAQGHKVFFALNPKIESTSNMTSTLFLF